MASAAAVPTVRKASRCRAQLNARAERPLTARTPAPFPQAQASSAGLAHVTRGVWVLLPGASRIVDGGDRLGIVREQMRADGSVEVRWGDVKWTRDGSGGSVERLACARLAEAPGTTPEIDYASRQANWRTLTQAQRDANLVRSKPIRTSQGKEQHNANHTKHSSRADTHALPSASRLHVRRQRRLLDSGSIPAFSAAYLSGQICKYEGGSSMCDDNGEYILRIYGVYY